MPWKRNEHKKCQRPSKNLTFGSSLLEKICRRRKPKTICNSFSRKNQEKQILESDFVNSALESGDNSWDNCWMPKTQLVAVICIAFSSIWQYRMFISFLGLGSVYIRERIVIVYTFGLRIIHGVRGYCLWSQDVICSDQSFLQSYFVLIFLVSKRR